MLLPELSPEREGGLAACGEGGHDEDGEKKSGGEHEGEGAEVV
jgi:hypothetical protein